MPYIYKITNLINNKVYIGKTSHEKRPLYDAFNKYGIENFSIEEIEQVENDDIASEREKYWIQYYNSYVGFNNCNGYNATLGGDSKHLYNYFELSQAYLKLGSSKAVCQQYNCDTKTVAQACKENNIEIKINPNKKEIQRIKSDEIIIYSSITEAAKSIPNKTIEAARKNISRALNRGSTAYGYKWEYVD